MAKLRRLGNLAEMMLASHLQNRNAERDDERTGARQLELAQYNKDQVAKQAEEARATEMMKQLLGNPDQAARATKAGMTFGGWDPKALMGSPEQRVAGLMAGISGKKAEELPTDLGIEAQLRADPWSDVEDISKDPRYVKQGMDMRDARQHSLENLDAYHTGLKQDDAAAQAVGQGLGQEQVEADTFDTKLARKKTEYAAMTPLEADRARREAMVRVAAEWDPKIVAAKIDFETRKNIAELAQVGAKKEAEDAAARSSAVKGLMPTYQRYRELAINVVTGPGGARTAATGAARSAIDQIPYVGGVMGATLDAAKAGTESIFRSEQGGKEMAELDKLTTTLAQGMANAVLGNRGQTTENDRLTAKNILVSSWQDPDTAADMLAITDRMFMLLPSVADPNSPLPAGELIKQAFEQAKAEVQATPASPGTRDNAASRLQQLRRGRQ